MRTMSRRRMMLISSSQVESRLPHEYREVQWLRGTGTQYCETSYSPYTYPNNGKYYAIRGDITVLDITRSQLLLGGDDLYYRTGTNIVRFGIRVTTDNIDLDYGIISGGSSTLRKTFTLSNYGSAPLDLHYEINGFSSGNVVLNETTQTIHVENTGYFAKICIGAYLENNAHTPHIENSNVNIKAFSIYNENGLISDIIPCYRKADNKAGFYETGTGRFLTNLGSGSDWLIGPNK